MSIDRQWLLRELVRLVISPMLRWRPLRDAKPGFSIVLGTPWSLRDLLRVNLLFLTRMNLEGLDRIFVVFDRRPQQGASSFVSRVSGEFPGLPLEFHFHPPLLGWILEWVNQSKFYASTNWVLGLKNCQTRYAILHDFDLYPVQREFFLEIIRTMTEQGLRFSGSEYTRFDGLTDADGLIGTWELGIDVGWLRANHRPIQCYHSVVRLNGRRVDLDAFSRLQSVTPQRRLTPTVSRRSYAHVTNLCSTYLRLMGGRPVYVTWRLPFLWYLASLADEETDLDAMTHAMRETKSAKLTFGGLTVDFSGTHTTCCNVLREELQRMEQALFGACRPGIRDFIDTFAEFLQRYGNDEPTCRSAPTVVEQTAPSRRECFGE